MSNYNPKSLKAEEFISHEEILERAVTLAKLAYAGSSPTLARANNNQ